MWQKIKKIFYKHSRLYIVFFVMLVTTSIFIIGQLYFQNQIMTANMQTQYNLAKAKQILAAIPIWHKKIQTDQKIKIGIITDTHVRASLSHGQITPIRNFVADMQEFQPDFVINLGDVLDGSHETATQGMYELSFVKSELEKSGTLTRWVIGNHDLRAVTKEQFKETLDLETLDQVFDIGDYRFIILDANYLKDGTPRSPDLEKRYISGFLPEKTLEWLKKQLETDKRVFVFVHQGTFEDKSVGNYDHNDDDDDEKFGIFEEIEYEDEDWVNGAYSNKHSMKNADELNEIFTEYRVDAVFNGHMEARRYQKKDFTAHYSFTGTRKSKDYPQSYYELTIDRAVPDVTMYYKPKNSLDIVSLDFEDKSNIIRETSTLVKDGAGLEYNDRDWIIVGGERGIVFEDDMRKYVDDKKLKGIAKCNQTYYIGREDTNKLTVLNRDFEKIGELSLQNIADSINVEGVACAENDNLYIVTTNTIYKISLNDGKVLDKLNIADEELSFADRYEDILYVMSKKDNSILMIKDNKVVDKIPIKQIGEVRGIKASPQVINIIL
jgi:predicted phosphodiesterase